MTVCPQCENPVPSGSAGDLCGKCLASGGLFDDEDAEDWIEIQAAAKMGEVIGGWTVAEKIGEGAFGEVFRVERDGEKPEEGAMKVLKPGLDSKEILGRFETERRALEKLAHPNIATVLEAGQTERGRSWFVMELIRGVSLTEYCDVGNLNLEERLEIFAKICDAIAHAHSHGIVHRDLKPSNILVEKTEEGPRLKVIDFGIAKALSVPLTGHTVFTHSGMLIGTPEYMSPEQAAGNSLALDERSDIYSLGVLLFELITGRTPLSRESFEREGGGKISELVSGTELRSPSAKSPFCSVDPKLDRITLQALARKKQIRYQQADALAEDIRRFLRGEAVRALPAWRTQGAIRKRLYLRLAAVLVLVGMLISFLALRPARKESAEEWPWDFVPHTAEAGVEVGKDWLPGVYEVDRPMDDYAGILSGAIQKLRGMPDEQFESRILSEILVGVDRPVRVGDLHATDSTVIGAKIVKDQAVLALKSGKILLLSTETGKLHAELDCGQELRWFTTSLESGIAAVAGLNGKIFVIDCPGTKIVGELEIWKPAQTAPMPLAISPDGSTVVAGNADGYIYVFPWKETGDSGAAGLLSSSKTPAVLDVAISRDARFAAVGLLSGEVALFDTRANSLRIPGKFEEPVSAITFSPDDSEVFAADSAGRIMRWGMDGAESGFSLPGGTNSEREWAIDPRAGLLLMAVRDEGGYGVLRDLSDETKIGEFRLESPPIAVDVAEGPDGVRLVTAMESGKVDLWKQEGSSFSTIEIPLIADSKPRHVDISEDGGTVLLAGEKWGRLYDVRSVSSFQEFFEELGVMDDVAELTPGVRLRFIGQGGIAESSAHGEAGGREIRRGIPPDSTCRAVSGYGEWFAAGYGNEVRVWNWPARGEIREVARVEVEKAASEVFFGKEEKVMGILFSDSGLEVRRPGTGELIAAIPSLEDSITCVNFAKDLVIAGTREGNVYSVNYVTEKAWQKETSFESPVTCMVDQTDRGEWAVMALGSEKGKVCFFDTIRRKIVDDAFQLNGPVRDIDYRDVVLAVTGDEETWLRYGERIILKRRIPSGGVRKVLPVADGSVLIFHNRPPVFYPQLHGGSGISSDVLNVAESLAGDGYAVGEGKTKASPEAVKEAVESLKNREQQLPPAFAQWVQELVTRRRIGR